MIWKAGAQGMLKGHKMDFKVRVHPMDEKGYANLSNTVYVSLKF